MIGVLTSSFLLIVLTKGNQIRRRQIIPTPPGGLVGVLLSHLPSMASWMVRPPSYDQPRVSEGFPVLVLVLVPVRACAE